jgi:hypothetical protein
MKQLAVILVAMLCPVFLVAQGGASVQLPPGFVDGSKTPDLIPDSAAYRLVFLNLLGPNSLDQTILAGTYPPIAKIGLSSPDAEALQEALRQFGSAYSDWQKAFEQASRLSIPTQSLAARVDAIVQDTRDLLQKRLSSSGQAKFASYVKNAKKRMIVRR